MEKIIKHINFYYNKKEFVNYVEYYYDLYIIRIYKFNKKVIIIFEEEENIEFNNIFEINVFKKLLCPKLLDHTYKNNLPNKNFIIIYEKTKCSNLLYTYFKNISYKEKIYDNYFEYIVWTKDILFGKMPVIYVKLTNKLNYNVYWINENREEILSEYKDFNSFSINFENNIFNNKYRTLSGQMIKY